MSTTEPDTLVVLFHLLQEISMLTILEPGPVLSKTDFDTFETRHRLVLPDNYKEFLGIHNGGLPSPDIVDVASAPGKIVDIQVFFGLSRGVATSSLEWNIQFVSERYPQLDLLPIACDSGGFLFCLNPQGEIILLEVNGPGDGITHVVARSFEEFLSLIRDYE